MGIVEVIAIIIFIIVVLVLLYYILDANSNVLDGVKSRVPSSVGGSSTNGQNNVGSMGNKIKGTFNDYTSSFNTDAFSKKLNDFLNEKSEELIADWSLVTKEDLGTLETKWEDMSKNIDDLEERFDNYQKTTSKDIEDLDARLKVLEKEE